MGMDPRKRLWVRQWHLVHVSNLFFFLLTCVTYIVYANVSGRPSISVVAEFNAQ